MSLVSGPGRGGSSDGKLPSELELHVDKHVNYIQSLDTVQSSTSTQLRQRSLADRGKMSWSTG